MRVDCGGCHAHSQQPLGFAGTAAAQPGYAMFDLNQGTPLLTRDGAGNPALRMEPAGAVDVEFLRDIRPLLQARCVSCHQGAVPAGNLNLADLTLVGGLPGDYRRLAADQASQYGYDSVIPSGEWRQTNASRYIRMFQSRRSLLIWKIFGQRLDGWSNADHPTETTPGVVATLVPAGANPNTADLDFTGSIMPPAPALPLTADERLTFVRWIDLGAPIDLPNASYGWLTDDLRPTLTVSAPRAGVNLEAVPELRFAFADANSGINLATLQVSADFAVNGRPAEAALADLAIPLGDGRYRIVLSTPLAQVSNRHFTVSLRDNQGNLTKVVQAFAVTGAADGLLRDGFE